MEPTLGELLLSGAKLMVIGMGIVYLFLALLVWIIGITHKLIRDAAIEEAEPTIPHITDSADSGRATDAEIVAVIACALRRSS